MILQLNPTIWVRTPKGVGLCHFLLDYGEEHDLMWVVAQDDTGEIWTWPNPDVRFIPNTSLGAPRNGRPSAREQELLDEIERLKQEMTVAAQWCADGSCELRKKYRRDAPEDPEKQIEFMQRAQTLYEEKRRGP